MNTPSVAPKRRTRGGPSSPLEQALLDGTRALCAALAAEDRAGNRFHTWKHYWIASNGEIGRKKAVTTATFAGPPDPPGGSDVYRRLFHIETALVFMARTLCEVAAPGASMASAAAWVFGGWEEEPGATTRDIVHTVRHTLAQASPDELLHLLAHDPLRHIYHTLIPKAIRHTLGAYLSPPDLCAYVIRHTGAQALFTPGDHRLLEPSCGLGSFFCALLAQGLDAVERREVTRAEVGACFAERLFGIEKNLGSYVVTRYLHAAISGLLHGSPARQQNILWADSIFVDDACIARQLATGEVVPDRTLLAGLLRVTCACAHASPSTLVEHGTVTAWFDGQRWQQTRLPLREWLAGEDDADRRALHHLALRDAARLDELGTFEVLLGNPPWINWEHLDPDYKQLILPCWPPLGLFARSGRDRAFSKEDLSVLATYSACLRFGRPGTRAGLLLPQALFQSRKNAKGFRRFRLGQTGLHLRVDGVTDFSDYAAFGDAKNRTAAFFCTLSHEPATFPVRYLRFEPDGAKTQVPGCYRTLWAAPSDPGDVTSNWALFDETETIHHSKRATRTYRARTGVFTGGANAVYYVRVLGQEAGLVRLENVTEGARIKVEQQQFLAERDYLYPFARGRDIGHWTVDRPANQGIVLPHSLSTRIKPVAPGVLAARAPRTHAYLARFEAMLQTRASLTALDRAKVAEGFYAMLRVGDYTFAPYKVAWRYIAKDFCCAVIGPAEFCGELKTTILQEKLISIAFASDDEAYFVCAFLSSPPIKREIERRIVGAQVSVHVIEDIHIPRFDPDNTVHQQLARVCREGHRTDGLTPARSARLAALVGTLQG